MRPLEILILIFLFLNLLYWVRLETSPWRWSRRLPLGSMLAALLHLAFEGYRWQMLPLYAAVVINLGAAVVRLVRQRRKPGPGASPRLDGFWLRTSLGVLGGLALLAASAPPVLLPVPTVPAPTGPYPVGTYSVMVVDETRREIYSQDPHDPRRLMVQIWYPAQPEAGARRAPWVEDIEKVGPAIAEWIRLPSFFLDHLALARTHAYASPPLHPEAGTLPVLLFSHGWGGFRAQNTYQAEDLASHGYLVAAIEHSYASAITVFPDGTVAEHNPAGLPSGVSDAEFLEAANRLIDQWAGDLDYVRAYLDSLNASDPAGRFTARLALERLGVLGHSTGGGAAVEFCTRQPLCKAVLGMDAYLIPVSSAALETGLQQPALYMNSQAWPTSAAMRTNNTARLEQLMASSTGQAYRVVIAGTGHYDFTDLPALSPLAPQLKLKGPLPGPRMAHIVRTYGLAFFEQVLRGQTASLLHGPHPDYPEVTWLGGE